MRMDPERTVTVVLDLTVYDVPRLIGSLRDAAENNGVSTFVDIADQIEQQTKPPKPKEPTGLGAVVEDSRGVRWVRTESARGMENPWQATLHPAEGDAVRSLSYCD